MSPPASRLVSIAMANRGLKRKTLDSSIMEHDAPYRDRCGETRLPQRGYQHSDIAVGQRWKIEEGMFDHVARDIVATFRNVHREEEAPPFHDGC